MGSRPNFASTLRGLAGGAIWNLVMPFAMRDGIPCISSMHRIAKKLQAVKVFPWSDQGGPLAGLQCTDGVIWLLALQPVHDSPEMQCTETHVPGIPPVENTLETLTPKTLTPSPDHTCFYWAMGGGEGGISRIRTCSRTI